MLEMLLRNAASEGAQVTYAPARLDPWQHEHTRLASQIQRGYQRQSCTVVQLSEGHISSVNATKPANCTVVQYSDEIKPGCWNKQSRQPLAF